MSKHTPGPWRIVDREVLEDGTVYPRHITGGSRDLTICLLEHTSIATLAVRDPNGIYASDNMVEAEGNVRSKASNASLIVAAPDYDEASRAMVEALGVAPDNVIEGAFGSDVLAALNGLRAAIAKAEGR